MNKTYINACAYFLSALFLIIGIYQTLSKSEPIQEDVAMRKALSFGNLESPVIVYLITDWKCPMCHRMEPEFEKMAPEIMMKATLVFIDFPIHEATVNFIPYNLSFSLHNKDKYLELRRGLSKLSETTDAPIYGQITALATENGVVFQPLSNEILMRGRHFYERSVITLNANRTPMLIVLNKVDHRDEAFSGNNINLDNVLKAIDRLGSAEKTE